MALDLNDKSKNRIGVIDCVKGLAIIMIIITHCNWPDGLGKQFKDYDNVVQYMCYRINVYCPDFLVGAYERFTVA